MEIEFILAIITAIIVFILTLVLGEEFGSLLKSIGITIVILPILFYFLIGIMGMLNAEPENTQVIADKTISNIIDYIATKLPSIIISDLAGAIVGAIGGSIVRIFRH
jgi:hypothetical protein